MAFLSYAIAHGLQYLIFMIVVSVNASREGQHRSMHYRNLLKLLIFVLIVGFAVYRLADLKQVEMIKSNRTYAWIADFLFGSILGMTMSHFAIDAGAWKLSMARQRAYITKRFDFIFSRETSGAG